jgi:DNA-binding NtrC family response regulator
MPERQLRVLLVEDNPGDARLLREALREVNASFLHLDHVEQLSEARDRIQAESYDVMLLDLTLPDSHGLATIEKAQNLSPHTAIVVLTGVDDEQMALEVMRKGAQDYLIKGQTDGRLLVRAINYALERKHAMEERDGLIRELQEALATVKKLGGLLPICASCKRIRDDKGYWKRLEQYIQEHSEASFSHGLCPSCAHKLYPEAFEDEDGAQDV